MTDGATDDTKTKPSQRSTVGEIAATIPVLNLMALQDQPISVAIAVGIAMTVVFLSIVGFFRMIWRPFKKVAHQ